MTGQREVEYYTTDTMVGSARTNYFTSTLTPFNYQTPSVSTANITVQGKRKVSVLADKGPDTCLTDLPMLYRPICMHVSTIMVACVVAR